MRTLAAVCASLQALFLILFGIGIATSYGSDTVGRRTGIALVVLALVYVAVAWRFWSKRQASVSFGMSLRLVATALGVLNLLLALGTLATGLDGPGNALFNIAAMLIAAIPLSFVAVVIQLAAFVNPRANVADNRPLSS